MPSWIFIWLLRLLRGERFEKAKPSDYRFFSGSFVLIPVFVGIIPLSFNWSQTANAFELWLAFIIGMVLFLFTTSLWARFVPLRVSYVLGTILWLVAFWI